MGVYDKKEFSLKCNQCGVMEQIIFLDHGEGWGFPDWVVTGTLTLFQVAITDGEVTNPAVTVQACKGCGSADVAVSFG